jgi:diguanylate cyclase (GGDEF)-like protein/PAS domain S-box-containing protein
MTLQTKILLVISLTFVALILVLYAASQAIVLGTFAEQEVQGATQNVERVKSALADNLASLEGTARDWSLWDDTYAYIEDHNQAYFDSNLLGNTPMESNRLSLMLFVDGQGQVVFQKSFNYQEGHSSPSPPDLQKYIYSGSPILHHTSSQSSITGILALADAPILIASEPILPSDRAGPIKGTLIFGRFLDESEIKHLARANFLDLAFQPVGAAQMPPDIAQILPLLTNDMAGRMIEVRPLDEDTIAGYTILTDVYGKPALVLKAEMPRDVFMRGQETVRYYMFALLGVGIVFALVILLFIKRLILSRLEHLSNDTAAIAASGDVAARVSVGDASDELSRLAASTNNMLSALQRSHEVVSEGEERYRAVVEQTTEAIFLVDNETGRFLQANAASLSLLGYSFEELRQITLDDITAPGREHTTTRLQDTTGSLRLTTERRYRRKDGTEVPVEVSDSHITFGGRDVLCVVARDITDRKRAEIILRDLAMRDGLTGLYNRREMQRILKDVIERYERFGESAVLILMDIDHFKSVNDTYGHQVGDDVLRWISHVLQELTRPGDKIARYGGEEMAVILPRTSIDAAYEIAERLRRTIAAQPFEFTQSEFASLIADERAVLVPITISLGVAALGDQIDSDQALIEAADQALYEAKRSGRDCTRAYHTLSSYLRPLS